TRSVSMIFSPQGTRLATISDRHITLWDVATGQETATLQSQTGYTEVPVFSPDGMRLATTSGDRIVKLWNATAGQEFLSLRDCAGPVVFSPDGKRLATGSSDGLAPGRNNYAIKLWDVVTGQELVTFRGFKERARSLSFSTDGKELVTES